MKTRARKSAPRRGEKVYEEEWISIDHPRGVIILVDYEDKTVTVKFEDSRVEDYAWDDMQWTDQFEGLWLV